MRRLGRPRRQFVLGDGHLTIRAPRLRGRDLAREAALSILGSPGRSLTTVIGTVLGAAAFVASSGLGTTLNHQVASSFDVRRATEVLVEPESARTPAGWLEPSAVARLAGLTGVVAAGRRTLLNEHTVSRTIDAGEDGAAVAIIGADPAAVRVMAPVMTRGRTFADFHEKHATPVVLLPEPVARRLSITRTGVAVFIDGRPFTVMGIFRDVERRPEVMTTAVMPFSAAARLSGRGTATKPDVLVETAPGAAQLIGRQAPLALLPEEPAALRALAPPDPRTLRREIESSVTESTFLISAAALLIGTISIGNAATAGVAARTQEIGLRRAVGARRRHIFLQLVLETAALGGLGGLVGVFLGILATCLVSLAKGWTPVVGLTQALTVCAASAVAGLLVGLIPASRAARISPVQALQR